MMRMSECTFDRLDALISLGTRSLIDKEAEKFMQLSEDTKISSKGRRKVERSIKHYQDQEKMQKFIKPVKVAGIACLVGISLTFTACVSIPKVREAMWDAVVEWYDDYIAVRFQKNDPSALLPEAPDEIEELNIPGYLPDGYSFNSYKNINYFICEYYNSNDEYEYTFIQGLRDNAILEIDETSQGLVEVDINGITGIMVTDEDMMSVVWQDGKYSYAVQGVFQSESDILQVCKSVKIMK
jgi:hypothetical protein